MILLEIAYDTSTLNKWSSDSQLLFLSFKGIVYCGENFALLLYVPVTDFFFSLRRKEPWQIGWAWSSNIEFKWVSPHPNLLQTFWTIHQTQKWTSCGLSGGEGGRRVVWSFSGFIMKMFWNPLNFMALFKILVQIFVAKSTHLRNPCNSHLLWQFWSFPVESRDIEPLCIDKSTHQNYWIFPSTVVF